MTSSKKYFAIPAAAVALGLGAGAVAQAAEPTTEQLLQKIEALQGEVNTLKATQQTQSTLTAKQVDATVERVLNDAEKRSQLLQVQGFTAGYNNGRFVIQDAAGNFVLRPSLEFQFRGVGNIRDGGNNNDDDKQKGFEVSRMAFGFDGSACTPDLTYAFQWNTSTGGSVYLETAVIRYAMGDTMAIRAGQFANPVFHEQGTATVNQLGVTRSLVNTLISGADQAFTQAVSVQFDPTSQLAIEIGAEDGFNSGNSDFTDPSSGGSYDWGIFGRGDFFIQGGKAEAADFSARGNKNDLLAIGVGVDASQTGSSTDYLHTVDVQWENTGGLAIYGAYLGDWITNGGTGDDDFYNWGFLVQAGYMLNDRWEVYGRYDYTHFDQDLLATNEAEEYCELTLGVNWYMCTGNTAKVSFDVTYLPNGSPSELRNLGILAADDDEWVFRGQFQLVL